MKNLGEAHKASFAHGLEASVKAEFRSAKEHFGHAESISTTSGDISSTVFNKICPYLDYNHVQKKLTFTQSSSNNKKANSKIETKKVQGGSINLGKFVNQKCNLAL